MSKDIAIVAVPVSSLKPATYNPRTWNKEQEEALKESITRFGLVDPIIANGVDKRKNIVIGGHFRLKIAKDLGYTEVPVVYVNIPEIEREKELNLRLNKNTGSFDFKLLAEFDKAFLSDVGFSSEEMDEIFAVDTNTEQFDLKKELEKLDIKQVKVKKGDVYELDGSRLMCGDSTIEEDMLFLMDKDEEKILDEIEAYAKDRGVTMVSLARKSLRTWLDDGLFTRDFAPIFDSERHDTWNGDTKKSHKELFDLWYMELEKSRKYFAGLFSTRKLKRREMEMTILGETKVIEILTGESLYMCSDELEFARQYKKQVEMILPFTNFALFIEKYAKPVENYNTLCEFRKLGKKASDVFDANFTEEYDKLIESYEDEINLLNHELGKLTDMATEHVYTNADEEFRYGIHITEGRFRFVLEENDEKADIIEKYIEEFKKVMR